MNDSDEHAAGPRKADVASVLRALVSISRRGFASASLTATPLSVTDQSIMMALAEQPGLRSIDVAKMFRLNRSTVSRQVAGLVKAGLVRETEAPSGRGRPLELTGAGVTAYENTLQVLQRGVAEQLQGWSDEEIARFASDLGRFEEGPST